MTTFHFAWVDSTDTAWLPAFARMDEDIVAFEVTHQEGDHAAATVDIRNPRVGLLAPGRKTWAWLGCTDPDGTGGPAALFFGRIVGVPVDLQENIIRVSFIARPADFDARKRTLAETLKVAPYWDPVWIRPEVRDDPDVVLESRPALYHTDRITHAVTISDIIAGEDGTDLLTAGDMIAGSMNMTYGEPPLRRVDVEAEVLWQQQAQGTTDITARLLAAFRTAGTSEAHMVSSFTGQGLYDDWPEPGDDIGGGWTIGKTMTIKPADGMSTPKSFKSVTVKYDRVPESGIDTATAVPFKIKFPLWRFIPFLPVSYEASRSRSEKVLFSLHADVQALMLDASDTETLKLDFSSSEVTELIDGDGSNAVMPIGDLASRQYLPTDRGRQSIEYLISVARTQLLARSRTVNIECGISFARATELSCRLSARIVDDRLPGGEATGKIVAYSFGCNGDAGEMTGNVRIACCIGKGNTVTALAGNPLYVDDDYVDDDYQVREGETVAAIAGEVTYQPIGDPPQDDGVDFHAMTPANIIESLTVTNGITVQRDILSGSFIDITAATEALNARHTEVALVLQPVTGGPFEQTYHLTVSDLMVPKAIDLEATA